MIALQECGPLFEKGMVMAVLDHSFDVIILKLGVMKRVYVDVSSVLNSFFRLCIVYALIKLFSLRFSFIFSACFPNSKMNIISVKINSCLYTFFFVAFFNCIASFFNSSKNQPYLFF